MGIKTDNAAGHPGANRTATDYAEMLKRHFEGGEFFPNGTTCSFKVTPYSVVMIVDVPHHFDQLERQPIMESGNGMAVRHCTRVDPHAPHRWRWVEDGIGAERWCGGVS